MTTNNLFRALIVCIAIATTTSTLVAPVLAQDKKPATTKTSVHKTAAAKAHVHTTAVLWECQHCKEPMSYAEAKKKGFHCCGMPMVKVAQTKHTTTKKS